MTLPKCYSRYESAILSIDDYICAGHNHHEEEYSLAQEIVLVRSGIFERYDNFGKALVDSNHVLFFNTGQAYQIQHPYHAHDHSSVFTLNPTIFAEIFNSYQLEASKGFCFAYRPIDSRLRFQLLTALAHFQQQDSLTNNFGYDEQFLTLLGTVICLAYEKSQLAAQKNTRHTDLVAEVKLYLAQHFKQIQQLDDLRQTLHTSLYHLCRVFRQQTGQSIHQYVQRLRLFHALEILSHSPNLDLTTLALELGFASHSHFTTAFKQAFGNPPSDFRKALKTETFQEMSKILKV